MVSLSAIESSNASLNSSLPDLVAVFIGATKGIGEFSLRTFAKHARKPRIYFAGRSQEIGDRVAKECKEINPSGDYIFIKSDVSLIKNVDDVCKQIREKETKINLLFISAGTAVFKTKTTENLHMALSLAYYARMRFVVNLLPLIKQASNLRRVVLVFAGTKEGHIYDNDFPGFSVPMLSVRGHVASMITLGLEEVARDAKNVTFIHNFPGAVRTSFLDGVKGIIYTIMRVIFTIIGPLIFISAEECGERHVFFATSARFPPSDSAAGDGAGVSLTDEIDVARGIDGKVGSGVYSINYDAESAGPKVENVLKDLRIKGIAGKLWEHTEGEFLRITGKPRL